LNFLIVKNSYNFANAMQASIFISKYLVVFGCLISLSSFGQSIENKNVNTISVVKDTVNRRNSKQVDDMISYAKKFLGTPYRYAGTTPSGFDCSGFINYVMGNFGFDLVRSSYGLAELGETVRLSEIQPGDLMFFKGRSISSSTVGHVAMVIEVSPDAIKFIHSSTSSGVVIDNFKTSKYFIPRFVKAKRLDYGNRSKQ
jgi:cell wall-associated NlpC family hydrolase